MRRSKVRCLSRRDYKIELMKYMMDKLAQKGFVRHSELNISLDRFKFYCEMVGGVVVDKICKRKDFEIKILHSLK